MYFQEDPDKLKEEKHMGNKRNSIYWMKWIN